METSKKRKILTIKNAVLALLVAVAIYGVGSTYALFIDVTKPVINNFVGGKVDVAVVEKKSEHEDSTNNVEEYSKINKDVIVTKVVSIKNRNSDAYVRVILQPEYVSDDGSSTLIDTPDVTYTFEKNTKWKQASDGTYYYTKALGKDEVSDKLLKSVKLNQDIPKGYHLEVKVLCDAIAVRPNTNLKTIWNLENFDGLSELK